MLTSLRPLGTLTFLMAWLTPWRPTYCVRAGASNLAFHLHRRDAIGRHIAKYGTHEPLVTYWIAKYLAQGRPGIVIDVGANVGWHALHAAQHGRVDKVVAFEPDPLNVTLLERSIARNSIKKIIVDDRAIGEKRGTVRFYRYKSSNSGRHSVTNDHGFGSVVVKMTSLDAALHEHGLDNSPVALIKIDVEGFEPAVIAGAARTLARTDAVVLELSPELSRQGGLSTDSMIDQLGGAGFKPFALRMTGELIRVEPNDFPDFDAGGSVDLIWLKNDIAQSVAGAARNGMTLYQVAVENKAIVNAIAPRVTSP